MAKGFRSALESEKFTAAAVCVNGVVAIAMAHDLDPIDWVARMVAPEGYFSTSVVTDDLREAWGTVPGTVESDPPLPLVEGAWHKYAIRVSPDSIVVRWRTASSSDSRLSYGPAPGQLSTTISLPG